MLNPVRHDGSCPVLATERLRLRPFRESDLEAQTKCMGDPEVVRHLGATPFSREDTWRRMLTGPGMWAMRGYGYWAVEDGATSAWVGQLGFADFKRDMRPSIEGLPEMGWIFAPEAQGRGYAGEAASAALSWADAMLRAREIVAIIEPGNAPSIRLAEKIGFSEREDAVYRDEPILLFRRRAAP